MFELKSSIMYGADVQVNDSVRASGQRYRGYTYSLTSSALSQHTAYESIAIGLMITLRFLLLGSNATLPFRSPLPSSSRYPTFLSPIIPRSKLAKSLEIPPAHHLTQSQSSNIQTQPSHGPLHPKTLPVSLNSTMKVFRAR